MAVKRALLLHWKLLGSQGCTELVPGCRVAWGAVLGTASVGGDAGVMSLAVAWDTLLWFLTLELSL